MSEEESIDREADEKEELIDIFIEYSHGNVLAVALSMIVLPLLLLSTILLGENPILCGVATLIYLVLLALITYRYFINSLSAIDFKEVTSFDPVLFLKLGLFSLFGAAALSLLVVFNASTYLGYVLVILWAIYVISLAYLSFVLFRVFGIFKYFIAMILYIIVILAALAIPPPYFYPLVFIPMIITQAGVGDTINKLTGKGKFELPSKMYRKTLYAERREWLAYYVTELNRIGIGVLSIGVAMVIDLLAYLILPLIDQEAYKLYINVQFLGPMQGLDYFAHMREVLMNAGGVLTEEVIYLLIITLIALIMLGLKYFLILNGIVRQIAPASFSLESSSAIEGEIAGVLKTSMVFNLYSILILVYMALTGLIGIAGLGDPSLLSMQLGDMSLKDVLTYISYVLIMALYVLNGLFCLAMAHILDSVEKSLKKGTIGSAPSLFYIPLLLSSLAILPSIVTILSEGLKISGEALDLLKSQDFILLLGYGFIFSVMAAAFSALIACRRTVEVLREEIMSYEGLTE